jgi:hypothetical protein
MEPGRTAYFGRFTNLTNLTLVENCNPHPVMRKAGAISKSARPHGRRLADQVSSKIKARARGKSKTKVLAIGTPITWKIGNIAKPSRYAAGFDKALANQQRLKPLVKTYAKAFERSRQIGQPVTIVSEVSAGPTNEITIVIEDPASSQGATGLQESPEGCAPAWCCSRGRNPGPRGDVER